MIGLPSNPITAHTSYMTPHSASRLALIGTLLLTVLVAVDFLNTVEGVLRDAVPAVALLRSLIYLFASISVTVFFWVFNKSEL
jgi:hypothetical protein